MTGAKAFVVKKFGKLEQKAARRKRTCATVEAKTANAEAAMIEGVWELLLKTVANMHIILKYYKFMSPVCLC